MNAAAAAAVSAATVFHERKRSKSPKLSESDSENAMPMERIVSGGASESDSEGACEEKVDVERTLAVALSDQGRAVTPMSKRLKKPLDISTARMGGLLPATSIGRLQPKV